MARANGRGFGLDRGPFPARVEPLQLFNASAHNYRNMSKILYSMLLEVWKRCEAENVSDTVDVPAPVMLSLLVSYPLEKTLIFF